MSYIHISSNTKQNATVEHHIEFGPMLKVSGELSLAEDIFLHENAAAPSLQILINLSCSPYPKTQYLEEICICHKETTL